jgi:hypothetical protein
LWCLVVALRVSIQASWLDAHNGTEGKSYARL